MPFLSWLHEMLRRWVVESRPADFTIHTNGDPYLRRWHVIPHNRWLNIYLHQTIRDDRDRELHDHPWNNVSILLKGGYWEEREEGTTWRRPGSVIWRRAETRHRLLLWNGEVPCWSLFITGPKIRDWGFWVENPDGTKTFVPWREFVEWRDR